MRGYVFVAVLPSPALPHPLTLSDFHCRAFIFARIFFLTFVSWILTIFANDFTSNSFFYHHFIVCSERLDQSFGRLFIEYSGKFMLNPYCNWTIENGGSAQDVAIVSIHYMRLRSCR